ncbi:MAG: S8 family serine peptidase [bacterium]|nr:S8 family serine peptidase [bacterium]
MTAASGRHLDPNSKYNLTLGSVHVQPAAGQREAIAHDGRPFLVQFDDVPDRRQQKRLRRQGIELLRYVDGNMYLVRCRGAEACRKLEVMTRVRATLELAPAMKRSRLFDAAPALVARARSGEPIKVHLKFFRHVPFGRASEILREHRIPVDSAGYASGNALLIEATRNELESLLRFPEVEWADPALPPPAPASKNAAERMRIVNVRGEPAFKGADGSGVGVALVDNYPNEIHTDLEGRVTRVRTRPSIDHGTSMSGIIAGAGILDPRARGMAPKARLYWYSQAWDTWDEMRRGRDRYGFGIVNNSWSLTVGWWFQLRVGGAGHWSWREDTWAWGYYHALAAAGDDSIRESDLLFVFAAANQRQRSYLGPHTHGDQYENDDGIQHQDIHPPNPEYRSIVGHALAKNVLTVGATTKDDRPTYFSSWGSTNDGRVKPDVVATGLQIYRPTRDDGYGYGSGTSDATAAVSGTAALLTDYYRRKHKSQIGSAMLKNLLIHSARDLEAPGPQYSSGWGLVDAELAARVVRSAALSERQLRRKNKKQQKDPLRSLMLEKSIDHKKRQRLSFEVPEGTRELRATLVWHDPSGERLVNDLDIWLKGPSTKKKIRPWVLDGSQPTAPPRKKRNQVDNVEHVLVVDPEPGDWTLRIKGRKVPMGPQPYTLIVSAGDGNRPAVLHPEGQCLIDDFFTARSWYDSSSLERADIFRAGDTFTLHMRPLVSANGDYGDYYGSIRMTFLVRNAAGHKILQDSDATHATYRLDPQQHGHYSERYIIPTGLPAGSYRAEGILSMANGCRDRATRGFRVE